MLPPTVPLPPRPARKRRESDIVAEIRAAFAKYPWVVCFRNNTGRLPNENGRLVKFGLAEGSSDLIGIVSVETINGMPIGRFFALEIKKPGERPTKAQARFLDLVRSMGGAAGWTTSAEHAAEWIRDVRAGLCNG
jgi:hypothetical protein